MVRHFSSWNTRCTHASTSSTSTSFKTSSNLGLSVASADMHLSPNACAQTFAQPDYFKKKGEDSTQTVFRVPFVQHKHASCSVFIHGAGDQQSLPHHLKCCDHAGKQASTTMAWIVLHLTRQKCLDFQALILKCKHRPAAEVGCLGGIAVSSSVASNER